MQAILGTETPWTISFNVMHSKVEEAWKLAIEAQDHQHALAGAAVGTPSVCQLPGGPSLKIHLQTGEAVSLEFCLMLLSQTYHIDYTIIYTSLTLRICTIQGWLADGACWTVVWSYELIMDLQFDHAYDSNVMDDRKSWLPWIEVLFGIYNQFFFTVNCSLPPIALSPSLLHRSSFNLLLCRHQCWQL